MKKQKNPYLVRAREKLELNQRELAKILGISTSHYGTFENLKILPTEEMQKKICDYFISNGVGLFEEEVFSESLYSQGKIPKLMGLNEIREEEIPYEENLFVESFEKNHRRKTIEKLFSKTITPKEEDVLRDYFGMNKGDKALSLDEIGEKYDITRERARIIREKGLRKLRGEKDFKGLRVCL